MNNGPKGSRSGVEHVGLSDIEIHGVDEQCQYHKILGIPLSKIRIDGFKGRRVTGEIANATFATEEEGHGLRPLKKILVVHFVKGDL